MITYFGIIVLRIVLVHAKSEGWSSTTFRPSAVSSSRWLVVLPDDGTLELVHCRVRSSDELQQYRSRYVCLKENNEYTSSIISKQKESRESNV